MLTTATAPTSTVEGAVDVAPNLIITEERSTTMKRNQPEQHNQQFMFIDENDKDKMQLNNEPTVPDWAEVVQIPNKTSVIDTNGYFSHLFPLINFIPKDATGFIEYVLFSTKYFKINAFIENYPSLTLLRFSLIILSFNI